MRTPNAMRNSAGALSLRLARGLGVHETRGMPLLIRKTGHWQPGTDRHLLSVEHPDEGRLTMDSNQTSGTPTGVPSSDLLALIRSEPNPDSHIFRWGGKWEVTNEWLCGGFAGRSFSGETPEQAAEQLSAYLTRHVGHKSMVGDAVTRSGWPNLAAVKSYLLSCRQPDEDDGANSKQ